MQEQAVFLLSSLAILAAPGPTNALLATAGAFNGLKKSASLLVAETLGYLLSIGITRMAFDSVSSLAHIILPLKATISVYLLYVATKIWQSNFGVRIEKPRVSFSEVFLTTAFNPKVLIFAFGIIPFGNNETKYYLLALILIVPLTGMCWIFFAEHLAKSAPHLVSRMSSIFLGIVAGTIAGSSIIERL